MLLTGRCCLLYRLTCAVRMTDKQTPFNTQTWKMSSKRQTHVGTEGKKDEESVWKLNHVAGDLFSCPESESLAHCISEDCRMGAGIAVVFKQRFGGVSELKEQNKVTGQCAVLKRGQRFVYYLVTKKKYSWKPTYGSLTQSLEDMKSHCLQNDVTKVSMPRIGCGLDRLQWSKVEEILREMFQHTNISITVFSLPQKEETSVMKESTRH